MPKFNIAAKLILPWFFCGSVYAGSYTDFVGSPIETYHYYSAHPGLLVAQKSMTATHSCKRNDLYILRKEHPFYKEMTALILSSHLVGQPLTFILGGCFQDFAVIENVVSNRQ